MGLAIVLLILHLISRSITKPVVHLAQVTKQVAEGDLDKIDIPPGAEARHDEISMLYHSFFDMVKGLQEKERVRGILNKVVSPEIADAALQGKIQLGGEEREVTVLFADIRGFTHLVEHMAPSDVITLINECMTRVSRVIDQHDGVIDKYVGDEVMALFGAPVEKEGSPSHAVSCAAAILKELQAWNGERKQAGLAPIEMGIGVHTGVVVAGNMGAENRLNYTVLGANVNVAARLCENAAPMELLISKATHDKLGGEVPQTSPHEPISLKGFTEPLECYALRL